jgi:hypothetical protein
MLIGVSIGLKARLYSYARCRQLRLQNIGTRPLGCTLILALHRRHLTVRGRRFGRRMGIISSLPFVSDD